MAGTGSELLQLVGAAALGREFGQLQAKHQRQQQAQAEQQQRAQQEYLFNQQVQMQQMRDAAAAERIRLQASLRPPPKGAKPAPTEPSLNTLFSGVSQYLGRQGEKPWAAMTPEEQAYLSYVGQRLPGILPSAGTQAQPQGGWVGQVMTPPTQQQRQPQPQPQPQAGGWASKLGIRPGVQGVGGPPGIMPMPQVTPRGAAPPPTMAGAQMPAAQPPTPGMVTLPTPGGIGVEVPGTMRPGGPGELGTIATALKGMQGLGELTEPHAQAEYEWRNAPSAIQRKEVLWKTYFPQAFSDPKLRRNKEWQAMVAAGAGAKTFAEAWGLMTKARVDYRQRADAAAARAFSQGMERARLDLSRSAEARARRNEKAGGVYEPPTDSELRQAKGAIYRHLKLHTPEGVTAEDVTDYTDPWQLVLPGGRATWPTLSDDAKKTALDILSDAMATVMEGGENPENMIPGIFGRPSGHRAIMKYHERTGKTWQ